MSWQTNREIHVCLTKSSNESRVVEWQQGRRIEQRIIRQFHFTVSQKSSQSPQEEPKTRCKVKLTSCVSCCCSRGAVRDRWWLLSTLVVLNLQQHEDDEPRFRGFFNRRLALQAVVEGLLGCCWLKRSFSTLALAQQSTNQITPCCRRRFTYTWILRRLGTRKNYCSITNS